MSRRKAPVSGSSIFERSARFASGRLRGAPAACSLVGTALVLTAASVAPARWLLALEQGNGARARGLFFAGGLLCDLATVGPVVALGLLVILFGVSASRTLPRKRRLDRAASIAFAVVLVSLALLHNTATLFRIQRGVFPGPLDARQGLAAPDFLLSELPEVLGGKFLVANLAALLVVLLVARRARARFLWSEGPPVRPVVALVVTVATFLLLGLGSRDANAYCARLHNGGALLSPASTWLESLVAGQKIDGTPSELRRLVSSFVGTSKEVEEGARAMGYPPATEVRLRDAEANVDCSDHPFARPLEPVETPIGLAARNVSRELFRGESKPIIVFHVSLESVRADDIAALEPRAPRGLTPFLTRVYEGEGSAAAFRHAHQSGIRTVHALSAIQCGVGALPFHLALGRDLGNVPLRCMTDVLHDAGFHGRAFYGHELAIDDMSTFLRYHGLELHERGELPRTAPRGVWGAVTDGPVFDAALASAARDKDAQYNFVLTMTHHTPYTEPEDLAPAVRAEVDAICAERGLTGENCARLRTLRYSDLTLARFVEQIEASEDAARTVIVFAADHTTHQWVPWGETEKPDGISGIPLVVWLPRAFRERVVDRSAFEESWKQLRGMAASRPISNTDLPALMLSLLADAPGMRELPVEARWHTLGGQATSSTFHPPLGDGALFGIDAHAQLFAVDSAGEKRAFGIEMDTLRTRDDMLAPAASNRGMLALWGSFLRGYGAKCARPTNRPRAH